MNNLLLFTQQNWLLIICILAAIYLISLKNNTETISDISLNEIEAVLSSNPIQSHTGGDMPDYFIKFYIKGTTNKFIIKDYAYESSSVREILSLRIGDTVKIKFKNGMLSNIYDEIYVYSFKYKNIFLLNLDNFNKCHVSPHKGYFFLILLSIIFLCRIFIFLYSIRL